MSDTVELSSEPARPEPVTPPAPVFPEYVFHGHASAKTSFQIVVRGPCGAKEFRKLLKLLEAQIEVLEDNEDQP